MEKKSRWYSSPFEDKLNNQRFFEPTDPIFFKGMMLPANFQIQVSDDVMLSNGQVIGNTTDGQILYWSNGQVIAKG